MKTIIFKSAIALAAILALFSCQKEDWTYKGPQYFEFSAYEEGQTASNGVYTKENGEIGLSKVCVQLVKHSDAPVTVAYKIVKEVYYLKDESRLSADLPAGKKAEDYEIWPSTAEYGTDYEIVAGSGSTFSTSTMSGTVTIPAGEYFGYITVDMKIKSGNNFYIVLVDSEDTKANKPSSILNYVSMPDMITYFEESFLEEIPSTFTIIDKDGDGYCWEWYDGEATSDSWKSGGIGPLTPENYLVTPAIAIGSKMKTAFVSFDVRAKYDEGYRLMISTSPITEANCRDADVALDWQVTEVNAWVTINVDISAYKGKTVYVALVHGNCTDQYYIRIKNLKVYGI
ncbi:MAG: choice-of-anchor J domain-containing protein [Bacteroidales bacterium]|nr:choice-of-anchor J domain-containing protein [Bacteroidales bacterium]MBR6465630.1 choice-of-anchor J domain-containing protein [Bacteroidales bacterium]